MCKLARSRVIKCDLFVEILGFNFFKEVKLSLKPGQGKWQSVSFPTYVSKSNLFLGVGQSRSLFLCLAMSE